LLRLVEQREVTLAFAAGCVVRLDPGALGFEPGDPFGQPFDGVSVVRVDGVLGGRFDTVGPAAHRVCFRLRLVTLLEVGDHPAAAIPVTPFGIMPDQNGLTQGDHVSRLPVSGQSGVTFAVLAFGPVTQPLGSGLASFTVGSHFCTSVVVKVNRTPSTTTTSASR
jgi:hypothetical protein